MPLHKGRSDKVVSANISELMHSSRSQKQSIAIAMSKVGKSRKKKKSSGKNYSKEHLAMAQKMMEK